MQQLQEIWEMHIRFMSENLKGRGHLKGLGTKLVDVVMS
jgi:hypothetical protein